MEKKIEQLIKHYLRLEDVYKHKVNVSVEKHLFHDALSYECKKDAVETCRKDLQCILTLKP